MLVVSPAAMLFWLMLWILGGVATVALALAYWHLPVRARRTMWMYSSESRSNSLLRLA